MFFHFFWQPAAYQKLFSSLYRSPKLETLKKTQAPESRFRGLPEFIRRK